MITLTLTRDSVSQGDDAFEHTTTIKIDEEWKISQILNHIFKLNYLPYISGGMATWSVATNIPIAVTAQEWLAPMLICDKDYPHQNTRAYKPIERLHFNYHVQQSPELVFEVLSHFQTI